MDAESAAEVAEVAEKSKGAGVEVVSPALCKRAKDASLLWW
jgi:hypothetical protein